MRSGPTLIDELLALAAGRRTAALAAGIPAFVLAASGAAARAGLRCRGLGDRCEGENETGGQQSKRAFHGYLLDVEILMLKLQTDAEPRARPKAASWTGERQEGFRSGKPGGECSAGERSRRQDQGATSPRRILQQELRRLAQESPFRRAPSAWPALPSSGLTRGSNDYSSLECNRLPQSRVPWDSSVQSRSCPSGSLGAPGTSARPVPAEPRASRQRMRLRPGAASSSVNTE
jgi:hypothetical protein